LKIVPNKGESQAQLNARADAKLADAQDDQCAGNITLFGNALLVAGQYGRFTGAMHNNRNSRKWLDNRSNQYFGQATA
jgi:putative bacteriophage regulatory protein